MINSYYNYKKFAVLYVDDEEKSLKNFTRAFEDDFRILTAPDAAKAFELLATVEDIGIIITDQRMPGETGVQFLEKARQYRPKVIRILVTAYTDYDALSDAVNSGAIYKYISKPWEPEVLEMNLRRAMELFIIQRERDVLMREKLSALHKMVITDRVISLGVLAAGLGHHLRNAMVAIRTFIDLAPEMLHREQPDIDQLRHPEFWNSFYKKVQQKVQFIVKMLEGLDEATEQSAEGFSARESLRRLADDALSRRRNELVRHQINVTNDIPADLPELRVDGHRFPRLFDLLLDDELLNLPAGSNVVFSASQSTGEGGESMIALTLQDDGPGLPEAAIRSIFDPFFLRADEPQEYGLNLMACYFIVYHHGGTVEVTNNNEKGLSFTFHLPLEPTALDAENDPQQFLEKVMHNERLWESIVSMS